MVDDIKDFQAYGINDFSKPTYLSVHWFIIRTINSKDKTFIYVSGILIFILITNRRLKSLEFEI